MYTSNSQLTVHYIHNIRKINTYNLNLSTHKYVYMYVCVFVSMSVRIVFRKCKIVNYAEILLYDRHLIEI